MCKILNLSAMRAKSEKRSYYTIGRKETMKNLRIVGGYRSATLKNWHVQCWAHEEWGRDYNEKSVIGLICSLFVHELKY